MQLQTQPTFVTITFSPSDYYLKKCDEVTLGDFMLVHRINMSYAGKDDQVGSEVLYLNEAEANIFRRAGFSEII